jgi:hypothetical protein
MPADVLWNLKVDSLKSDNTKKPQKVWPSRGIPFVEFWPFALLLGVILLIVMQSDMFVRCIGYDMPAGKGAGTGFILMGLSILCSPFLLTGSYLQIGLFSLLLTNLFFLSRLTWRLSRHSRYLKYAREQDRQRRKKAKN